MPETIQPGGELLFYQSEDGQTKIEVRMVDETVWLTQAQMVELFQSSKSNINEHLKHIFEENELTSDSVVRKFRTTAADGKSYETLYYNLDVIISVGYRVKSHRGTQFRIWATQRLKEYIIKGFTMDDERLKQDGSANYFDELLTRIRDIRSTEKVFYRKILEIYATSIDYDPHTEQSHNFFATVQNKMHWAAHGQTAAELIYERVDSSRSNIGLTNWQQSRIRKEDLSVAKNYLTQEELELLNRIVSLYLDFAELQAQNRRVMYMKDWHVKLDDFLRISDREILTDAGRISHEMAITKTQLEYEKYKQIQDEELSSVERHFEAAIQTLEKKDKR